MRGRDRMAVAVRRPEGTIAVKKEFFRPWVERHPVLRWPFLRGPVMVAEALSLGVRALLYSASQAEPEGRGISRTEGTVVVMLAVVLAVGMFTLFPTWAARALVPGGSPWLWHLVEGILRVAIFLGYVWLISLAPDIKRVFQYHGAEHKVIHAYEAGEEMTVESARKYPPEHPRCGTSFLLLFALLSLFVFAFTGWPSLGERLLWRLGLLPVVVGVAYEALRLGGRSRALPARILSAPGLWLQRLTTREPDDSQLEVALRAFQAVRE